MSESLHLYFAYECPSSRVALMTVHALEIEDKVQLTCYDLIKKEHINDEYRKINPRLKVPALIIGDVVITESRAIAMYLADRFLPSDNTMYPRDILNRALVNASLFFDIAVVYKPIHDFVLPQCLPKMSDENKTENEEKAFSTLNEVEMLFSDEGPFQHGKDITLVDISMLASFVMLLAIDYPLETRWPKVSAWLQHCQKQLPYFEKCNRPGIDRLKKLYAIKHAQK